MDQIDITDTAFSLASSSVPDLVSSASDLISLPAVNEVFRGFTCLQVGIDSIVSARRTPAITDQAFTYKDNKVDTQNVVANDICPGKRPCRAL